MSERNGAATVRAAGDGHLRIVDEHSAGPKVTPEPAPPDERVIGLSAIGVGIGIVCATIIAWWMRRHVRITLR